MASKDSHSTDSSVLGDKNHLDHFGVLAEAAARMNTLAPLMATNQVSYLDELHISASVYNFMPR